METLQGKQILIGGVSGGIGLALAQQLRKFGASVHGFGRSPEPQPDVAGFLKTYHGVDATRSADLEAVFDSVSRSVGRIDGYAHCIGSILLKTAHQTSDEEWFKTLNTNLTSAFFALRASVKRMQKHKAGSIVLIGTGAARIGIPAHEAIAAAKGGLEALARGAAASYATRGLRINCVAPGMVDTPLAKPIIGNAAGLAFSTAMHPLGRLGQPSEIASLIAWLLSDDASWVSGQTYGIDGGLAGLKQRPRVSPT